MPRQSYAGTMVPVGQTQQQIRKLLVQHEVTGVQFAEDWAANQLGFSFHRIKVTKIPDPEGGKSIEHKTPMTVRMLIHIWPQGKTPWFAREQTPAGQREREQRERQVWRALYWYLKSQLEAVEFGLRSFEDAFLSDIVVADGRVIGDHIKQAIDAGTMTLALPAPER